MTQPTFDRLLWDAVKDYRNSTMVVDNHHAFAIIKDRLDSFWEQVRLAQPDEDQQMVLGGLLGIAMAAQLAAENLTLVPEQLEIDDSIELEP
jgi:hypothetical protein